MVFESYWSNLFVFYIILGDTDTIFRRLVETQDGVQLLYQVEQELLQHFEDNSVLELEDISLKLAATVTKDQSLTHGTVYAFPWLTEWNSRKIMLIRWVL